MWSVLKKIFSKLGDIERLSPFGVVAAVAIAGMMILVVANACGRKIGHPIAESYEGVQFFLVFVFFYAAIYTAIYDRHFKVNIIVSRFKPRTQAILNTIASFFTVLVCWLLAWQLWEYGLLQKENQITGNVISYMPIYPFVMVGAFGILILGLVYLVTAIKSIAAIKSPPADSVTHEDK